MIFTLDKTNQCAITLSRRLKMEIETAFIVVIALCIISLCHLIFSFGINFTMGNMVKIAEFDRAKFESAIKKIKYASRLSNTVAVCISILALGILIAQSL